jgi:hypothetical protein
MKTRLSLAALLACAALLPAAAADKTEPRALAGFTAIALAAPIRVELTLGDRDSVVLQGDEEQLRAIETSVEDGTLRIRRKPGAPWNLGWGDRNAKMRTVRALVCAKKVEALSIAGSGDIHSPELRGAALKISVAGSGDVLVGGGNVESLAISIAGSGDIKTAKLDAQHVKVSNSGSGDATVWARQKLSVRVAGSGDVRYYGDPELSTSVVGSGDITRVGASPG